MCNCYTVTDAITELKAGTSAGMDGLVNEHYEKAGDRLDFLFSLLFNSMTVHGYIPKWFNGFYYYAVAKR